MKEAVHSNFTPPNINDRATLQDVDLFSVLFTPHLTTLYNTRPVLALNQHRMVALAAHHTVLSTDGCCGRTKKLRKVQYWTMG